MEDKSLGYTIMTVSIILMAGYFIWAFAPWLGSSFAWLALYAEWAYKLPVMAAGYLMLLIILWIGYTMATTPPPIPLDVEIESEEKNDEKSSHPEVEESK